VTRERRWLVEALREHLLPEITRRGFEIVPLSGEDARGEIRVAFPFGRLRRAAMGGFELIEIQLDKRSRAAFRLNAGRVPAAGIDHFTGSHIVAEDVWVTYLRQYYALYQCAFFGIWFQVRHWPGRTVTESNFQILVREGARLLPEIDAVLISGKCGPHIKRIG
jgi:hypothetical protein